jgi:hypothetical protein
MAMSIAGRNNCEDVERILVSPPYGLAIQVAKYDLLEATIAYDIGDTISCVVILDLILWIVSL